MIRKEKFLLSDVFISVLTFVTFELLYKTTLARLQRTKLEGFTPQKEVFRF